MNGALEEEFILASASLQRIWKMRRAETNPLSDVGLVIGQCKLLQLQIESLVLMNDREEQ
jgi:hypothetical protein